MTARGPVAAGEGLKVCKKHTKQSGPGMTAEGMWPLADGRGASKAILKQQVRTPYVWQHIWGINNKAPTGSLADEQSYKIL
jgi:hypothetical protein